MFSLLDPKVIGFDDAPKQDRNMGSPPYILYLYCGPQFTYIMFSQISDVKKGPRSMTLNSFLV